ncbi:MAG: MFS transporter [Lachnospiraceae bacterium]|nr:MFS transporter [Lachnospiraceae bacterium]
MRFKATLKYCILQGAFWSTFSCIFAYASMYLLDKGLSNTQIGYILSAGSILSAIAQPIVGGMADRSKKLILHKLLMAFSGIIIILSGLLLSFNKVFWMVFLLYTLIIAFSQIMTPLTYSLAMFFVSKGVPIDFGVARGIGSLAYAICSAILGVLIEKQGVDVIVFAIIIVYILLIATVVTFHFKGVDENVKNAVPGNESKNEGTLSLIQFIIRYKRFFVLIIGNILVFVSHNIISNYMFQIYDNIGLTSSEMGYGIFIAAACELPALFLLSTVNKKVPSGTLFKFAVFFIFVRNVVMYLAKDMAVMYFSMSLSMLGYGIFAGISIIYVENIIDSDNRVRGQALMTMTTALGSFVGSLLGGIIIDRFSVDTMLIMSSLMALAGALIVIITGEKGKTE